ncbi:RHS repeat-associated protein [Kitasatospora sp. MAA4]|uniref:RHS repeat domain-containing protein n=1 Tax=Kitasatospora sp. MAA4 TaxID=3035093 RepID=UPI0024744C63|nr:RHS repeat-associated core domain-containing protein [Kitasatospora sp. MAA4]MDH6137163.1 RHS repeat-associated protein [Kitasatospora sp. MAA4]
MSRFTVDGRATLRRLLRSSAMALAAALVATASPPVAFAAAKPKPQAPAIAKEQQLPYKRAGKGSAAPSASFAKFDPTQSSKLPAAGSAVADLSTAVTIPAFRSAATGAATAASSSVVRAGSLPVLVGKGEPAGGAAGGPSRVRVDLLDQNAAQTAGVHGILFTVAAQDASAGSGSTTVSVDPSSFRSAFGGDYAARLHLVQLPACALTTPQLAQCRTQTPVQAKEGGSPLTGTVTVPAPASQPRAAAGPTGASPTGSPTGVVLAATSSADGSAGSYSATSLSPAGTWSAGGATGAFNYAYPIKVPGAIAGATPDVSLSYDSSSQDGRTAGTNNQSSWLGDGWSSDSSFIERSYKSCASDKSSGAPQGSGDNCWAGQLLTLSLNGESTQIVYDGSAFRPVSDSADEKIEQLFLTGGASNSTYNGEYFRVTQGGTQYYFGLNQLPGYSAGKQTTQSVFTEPVYGAHAGDPCHAAAFADSSCVQGWRWNLDYTVDLHSNAIAYYYQPETNYYGADAQSAGALYTRGGYLSRIDYGLTASTVYSATAPEQIGFDVKERCISGVTCDDAHFVAANAAWWPDVPVDQNCAKGADCSNHSPSFWSRMRLNDITTQVQVGGVAQQADRYDFTQSFPDGGDHAPTLWLDGVQHRGLDTTAGATGASPALSTTFDPPDQLPNRVGTIPNQPTMYHDRIQNITTETGAQVTVTYNTAECTPGNVPADPSSNTKACYPVSWTPPNYTTPQLDWFNKYTVHSVRTQDQHQTNQDGSYPSLLTTYNYLGGAAWHYDDNELIKPENRTYGQFRGYGAVETRTGDPTVFHMTNGAKVSDQLTLSRTSYFRGMSDNTPSGSGGSTVTLTSQDGRYTSPSDVDALAGQIFETDTYTSDGGPVDHASVTVPTVIGPTASRSRDGLAPLTAQMVRTAAVYTTQAVSYGTRTTETDTFYTTALGQPTTGMPVQVDDRGEVGAAGNTPQCTLTHYLSNPGESLVLHAEAIATAQDCTTAGATPTGTLIADTRTSYDGNAFGWDGAPGATAPGKGDATLAEAASANSGPTATAFTATTGTSYDAYGRPLVVTRTPRSTAPDGSSLAQTTTKTYAPAAGALPTSVTTQVQVTAGATPTYQTSTESQDPVRGVPVERVDASNLKTDLSYDALGRVTSVWLPAQSKAAHQSPSMTFAYALSNTSPSAVTSSKLLENGSYASTVTLYDAMLRQRQTQAVGENSGMTVSDTQYDSHGWTVLTNNNYVVAGSPMSSLVMTAQTSIPSTTVTDHDAMGRATATNDEHNAVTPAGMATAVAYTGDSTVSIPKSGGVATRQVVDARGLTVEADQYSTAPVLSGSAQSGYQVTGGTSSATTYTYNPLGKQTGLTGPDGTTWTTGYDLNGRKIQQNDPDTGTTRLGYDDAGDLVSTTDARKVELDYGYDLLGRKVSATDRTGGNFRFGVWKYDTLQAGRLSYSARYVPGTTGAYVVQVTGYTSLGKPTGTKVTLPASEAPLPTSYATTLSYSAATQQLTDQRDPGVAGLLADDVLYGYSALGSPTSLQSVNALVGPVSYTSRGEISQITYGPSNNPAWSTYSYDDQTRALKEVQTSRTQAPGPMVDDLTYAYDPAGNPTSALDRQTDTAAAVTDRQCYQYDGLNRLSQAWTSTADCPAAGTAPTAATVATGSAAYWESFGYDAIGDRTSSVEHAVNGAAADTTTRYTNGCTGSTVQCPNGPQPHFLTATSTTGPGGTVSTALTASPAGATTKRSPSAGTEQDLEWDDEGHLAKITQGGNPPTTYLYDADGNQLIRRDPGQTTLFVGDTAIVVNTAVTPNVLLGAVRSYALGGSTVAMASSLPGGSADYVLSDPHGTATLTMDTTTQKATRQLYTPYGQNRGGSTGWPDPTRGFLGAPKETTTGYTDLGARKYDPGLGRFLSADPVLETGSPQQLGGYTYAASNPVGGSDPTGLERCLCGPGDGPQIPAPADPPPVGATGGFGNGVPPTALPPADGDYKLTDYDKMMLTYAHVQRGGLPSQGHCDLCDYLNRPDSPGGQRYEEYLQWKDACKANLQCAMELDPAVGKAVDKALSNVNPCASDTAQSSGACGSGSDSTPQWMVWALQHAQVQASGCVALLCLGIGFQDGNLLAGFSTGPLGAAADALRGGLDVHSVEKLVARSKMGLGGGVTLGFNTQTPDNQNDLGVGACAFDEVGGCASGKFWGSGQNFGAAVGGGLGVYPTIGMTHAYDLLHWRAAGK